MALPSYGIRRIQAAVVADPELSHCQLTLIDRQSDDVDIYVEQILACEPDLLGFSIYVWSTKCLIEVARRVKQARPQCLIIFGGPSARKEVFDMPIYPAPHSVLDGLVTTEGELIFTAIAKLPDTSQDSLKSIGGITLPLLNGWHQTGAAPKLESLDHIASPYQLGIMPQRTVAYLESFRGCPLSCRFCEWGAADKTSNIFSTDYLIAEFNAYRESQAASVFVVDAGLNLNAKAFSHLQEAEQEVGYLKECAGIWAEIYPTNIRDDHLTFLDTINVGYLGIGLQSIDPKVLKDQDRPFRVDKFEAAIRKLAEVAYCEVQIIMDLPGDTPDNFRKSFERARSLPCALRVYHCVVLPSALMVRAPDNYAMDYDYKSLKMQSCLGWSAEALQREVDFVTERAQAEGGDAGQYFWVFPPPR